MDDQEFEPQVPASAPSVGFDQSANKPDGARARLPTFAALLGLLAGDGDSPREGQRDIIASAIRHALDTSSTSEFPNLARLIDAAGIGELDQRAARCRSRQMHVRGQYQDGVTSILWTGLASMRSAGGKHHVFEEGSKPDSAGLSVH